MPLKDVCEILICANTTVYITGHPALPGTFCGVGKWCVSDSCTPWGNEGPMAVDGGCMVSVDYRRHFNGGRQCVVCIVSLLLTESSVVHFFIFSLKNYVTNISKKQLA